MKFKEIIGWIIIFLTFLTVLILSLWPLWYSNPMMEFRFLPKPPIDDVLVEMATFGSAIVVVDLCSEYLLEDQS